MEIRDAVEADAERMAALTGSPTDVMRNLVHDRTVAVAYRGGDGADPTADHPHGEEETLGFVSYDVQRETVHVTQIEGTPDACERLLREPARFAEREGMDVELLVAGGDEDLRTVAERVGFTERGEGPRFDGVRTVRYRRQP
ncbi:hypothetical protein [Halosegnis marinus]|uniref:N-acetyltransferase domain-containing protein n=1 Tax=Halosegnis marinus TaxID=3034023 RepID=A0ABD5ZPC9_9EURY|nr:hypothetical protein [Halosegnis sp. DT85]